MDDSEREIEKTTLARVGEANWADLPIDPLFSVFSRLYFPRDVFNARRVNRVWRSVPTPPQTPVLVCFGNDKRTTKVFHPLCHDSVVMRIPHELRGYVPLASREGWLLMLNGRRSISFFNPDVNAVIGLPDLPDDNHFQGMVFTACPTSSDCVVVGICGTLDQDFSISMIRRGEESWKVSQLTNTLPSSLSRGNLVFHRGDLYCVDKEGNLVVINPNEASWRVIGNPYRQPQSKTPDRIFLVECQGELLLVYLTYMGKSVSILKFDSLQMEWQEVNDLNKQIVFVCNPSSISTHRLIDGMENKVFLPRTNGKGLVFYSLGTRLFHSSGTSENLYGTGELLNSCWITPRPGTTYSAKQLNWIEENSG